MGYFLQLAKMAALGAIVGLALSYFLAPAGAALVALVVLYLLLVRVS